MAAKKIANRKRSEAMKQMWKERKLAAAAALNTKRVMSGRYSWIGANQAWSPPQEELEKMQRDHLDRAHSAGKEEGAKQTLESIFSALVNAIVRRG